jgi:uncharacterized protein (TIGR02679 family)
VNTFLSDSTLEPLWTAVAVALDRNGLDWRGRLVLPTLSAEGRRRLGLVIDRPVPPGRRTVPLTDLAAGVEHMTGDALLDVLDQLGHAPLGRREAARARRAAVTSRRQALAAVVAEFSALPWVAAWAEAAWRDGLFAGRSPVEVDGTVRRVLEVLAHGGQGHSRTDIAARVIGDSHALDSSTSLAALVTRALVERDGPGSDRAVWERAGMPLDLVSAPVLTWGLPLLGDSAVAQASRAMTLAGLPLHLSTVALRHAPVAVPAGTPVLVVENPRLVETAAERRFPAALLSTSGNATTAPIEAIHALQAHGARLRYHGDFDAAGLAMTNRMADLGCIPFLMFTDAYLAALSDAADHDVVLPTDASLIPATPWDDDLARAFELHRLVVHEERIMDTVLAAHAADL